MRSILFCIFLFFVNVSFSFSQTANCGTTLTATDMEAFDQAAYRAFQQRKAKERNNEKTFLGLAIYVVDNTQTATTTQGAVTVDIARLYDELDAVNRAFTGSDIQFFFCGSPRYIEGKGLYSYDQAARELNSRNHIENTINIFYLDDIGQQSVDQNRICGISQFPWRFKARDRFIIMKKDCSTDGSTLAHEIGHFLGLLHTHETANGRELVDGSNCMVAGDLVCDTPADPNLGLTGLNGCSYQGTYTDANGQIYSPNSANVMSYAPSRCQNRFTPGQVERMQFFLETTDLADIISDCDFYPDFAIAADENNLKITSGQVLNIEYTFDNQGITEDQEVEIHFKLAQEGELELIIHKEIIFLEAGSSTITKTINVEFPISKGTGNYVLTAALDPESIFLERDKRNNFHSINIEVDNNQFSDGVLFPNPADDRLKIFVRDKAKGGDITLQVVDYMGRVYYEEKKFKRADEFFAEVAIDFLPAGLYILNVRYDRDSNSQPFLFIKE